MSARARKILIGFVASLAGLVLLAFLLIGAALVYVNSESGSKRILAFAQTKLDRDFNITLTFDEASIRILRGFSFRNLKIIDRRNPENLNVLISDLRAEYDFSILARLFTLKNFALKNSKIVFHSQSEEENAHTEESKESSSIEDLLRDPPATLRIDSVDIEDLAIDASLRSPTSSILFSTSDLDLKMSALLEADRVNSRGTFYLADGSKFSTSNSQDTSSMKAQISASADWDLAVERNAQWSYQLKSQATKLSARDVAYFSGTGKDKMSAACQSVALLANASISAESNALLKIDRDAIRAATTEAKVEAQSFRFQLDEMKIEIPKQSASIQSSLKDQIQIQLNYLGSTLRAPDYLERATDAEFRSTFFVERDLSKANGEGAITLSKLPLLSFKGNLTRESGRVQIESDFESALKEASYRLVKQFESLRGKGNTKLTGHLKLDGDIPSNTDLRGEASLQIENSSYGNWTASPNFRLRKDTESNTQFFESTGKVSQTSQSKSLPIALKEPFAYNVSGMIGERDLSLKADVEAAIIDLLPVGFRLKNLRGDFSIVKSGNELRIEKFDVTSNNRDLVMSVSGTADAVEKSALLSGRVDAKLNNDFAVFLDQKLQGSVGLPFEVSALQGRDITLTGALEAKSVAWRKGPYSIAGFTGRVPFNESLVWDGETIGFSKLIDQNPFERVDFERVRPLLQGSDRIHIEKIGWEEKTYGPFIGFFSVRQNMIFGHQFEADLGSGRSYGETFINAHPDTLQFGILARLSGLNLNEALPEKFLKRTGRADKNLSARTGLVVDLKKNTIDGRVDVTEIGGPQLIAIINVLDPYYEDQKLNQVRTLLQVGSPTAVNLDFSDGYLNMNVRLQALGLTHSQDIRGIPVSNLVSQTMNEINAQISKGPIR